MTINRKVKKKKLFIVQDIILPLHLTHVSINNFQMNEMEK